MRSRRSEKREEVVNLENEWIRRLLIVAGEVEVWATFVVRPSGDPGT